MVRGQERIMTILPFAQPYRAWDTEVPTMRPLFTFFDSATGDRLSLSAEPQMSLHYAPGDTITLVHYHCLVTLEGQQLLPLFAVLRSGASQTIRTFTVEAFHTPAPGEPLVQRIAWTWRLPSSEEKRAWRSEGSNDSDSAPRGGAGGLPPTHPQYGSGRTSQTDR